MPDAAQPARPHVAMVFGDAGAADRLREAVSEHVDVVYATPAAEFDPAHLKQSGATAALVNLDAFDWLDAIAARLNESGVAVVFNDPETSSALEGWERARWLRHLTAKLSGSNDFDPPRPAAETPVEASAAALPVELEAAPAAVVVPETQDTDAVPEALPPAAEPAAAERPLSPAEIESMTVDFVAAPAPVEEIASSDAPMTPAETVPVAAEDIQPATTEAAPTDAAQGDADIEGLDVDTEALSAMIDARLAEPEHVMPVESSVTWQTEASAASAPEVVAPEIVAPEVVPAAEVADAPIAPATVDAVEIPAAAPAGAPADDDDIAAGFPALGDWALVDPEAPAAPVAASKTAQPESAAAIDFSGLELVPMEAMSPVDVHMDPVEHRLVVEERKKADATGHEPAVPDANGEHA